MSHESNVGLMQKWLICGRSPQFFAGCPQRIADSCVSSEMESKAVGFDLLIKAYGFGLHFYK